MKDSAKPKSPRSASSDSSVESGLGRRKFIKEVAGAAAVVPVGASLLAKTGNGAPKQEGVIPSARAPRWRLEAVREEQTFGDGSVLPFFRFRAQGNSPSNGNLPILRSTSGRNVSARISNTLSFPIQPTIVGNVTGPVIMPGETRRFDFVMPPVGTWMMTDALLGQVAGSAGFAAAIVSEGFQFFQIGRIDREYFLLYQDTDSRWNEAIDVGGVPDESIYEPNYHTLNGLSYPHTMMDPDTRLTCQLGENVLVRIGNLGHVRHSLHFHGYHARFFKRNNRPEAVLPEKDTFEIPAYSTAEIFLPINQAGEYPLHPHSLTSVTDNGTYPGGQITMIDASA